MQDLFGHTSFMEVIPFLNLFPFLNHSIWSFLALDMVKFLTIVHALNSASLLLPEFLPTIASQIRAS